MSPRPALALAVLALSSACATTPPEPPPPPFALEADHFVGSVRTGPMSGLVPAVDAGGEAVPWIAELHVVYAERMPPGTAAPASAIVRHVFVERGGETLTARAELALGVVRLDGDALVPEPRWEARQSEAVLAGTTTTWRTSLELAAEEPSTAPWNHFDVQLSRLPTRPGDAAEAELALVFEGLVTPRPRDDADEAAAPAAPVLQREHVVLDEAPVPDRAPYRLFLPAPNETAPDGGLVLELWLSTTHGIDGLDETFERAHANLLYAEERARRNSTDLSLSESFRFESEGALRALERRRLQRPALVFLAQQTQALLTGELALTADDEHLESYLESVRLRLAEEAPANEPIAFGWFLDGAAYSWMCTIDADPERELLPELRTLLLVHTGELGSYADLVQEVVAESPTREAFEGRLVSENLIFLEDGHPAARVRAYDWLALRGERPEDYDPLGSLADRRAALARLEADQNESEGSQP